MTGEARSIAPAQREASHIEAMRQVLSEADLARGLSSAEAAERLQRYGANDPAPVVRPTWHALLWRQLRSAIIIVLFVAMVASLGLQEWLNAAAIGISIIAAAGLGFAQEFRSERAISALRDLTALRAEVIRDGLHEDIPAQDIVPGDVVVVDEGDTVPADALVLQSHGLLLSEAVLTGESLPVEKDPRPLDGAPGLGWAGGLSAGTTVMAGSGLGVVYATGAQTSLGGIFASLGSTERRATPLESRLEALGRRLVGLFLVITAVVAVVGILQGRDVRLTIEMAVALAIGAVPEGLPAVATTSLAVAVRRLAAHRVLVRQLDAVETLGSTTLIVTDKTGTLTENRLVVRAVVLPDGTWRDFPAGLAPVADTVGPLDVVPAGWEQPARIIEMAAICGEAVVEYDDESGWHAHGDPSEAAISLAAAALGWHTGELRELYPRIETTPFDAARRYMRTVHETPDGRVVAVKGAPGRVDDLAAEPAPKLRAKARELGERGYRVLSVAEGSSDQDLAVIGAVVLEDPLRPDAAKAVEACREAGLQLMLATGDQLTTAMNIGEAAGLLRDHEVAREANDLRLDQLQDVTVVARASHDQKEAIVAALQQRGEVVAMLGDGVNDAPALSLADAGVAVGPNATDVAVQASQVVLADGRLTSLVEGIREGRQTARNLRQAIVYLLTASFATIGVISFGMLVEDDLPLNALQILWLNLVVHVFPALALSTGREGHAATSGPTRNLIAGGTWTEIAWRSFVVAIVALGLLLWAERDDRPLDEKQALVFSAVALTLLGQSFLIGVRSPRLLVARLRRPELWLAALASALFLLAAFYVPLLQDALDLARLSLSDWALIAVVAFVAGNITQAGTAIIFAGSRRTAATDR